MREEMRKQQLPDAVVCACSHAGGGGRQESIKR